MNWLDSSTSRKRSSSCGIRGAYCAFWSASGIVCTASQFMGPVQAGGVRRDRGDDEDADGDVHVTEVLVQPVVARAQRPARAGEAEAPRDAAEEGEREKPRKRHPGDTGRQR